MQNEVAAKTREVDDLKHKVQGLFEETELYQHKLEELKEKVNISMLQVASHAASKLHGRRLCTLTATFCTGVNIEDGECLGDVMEKILKDEVAELKDEVAELKEKLEQQSEKMVSLEEKKGQLEGSLRKLKLENTNLYENISILMSNSGERRVGQKTDVNAMVKKNSPSVISTCDKTLEQSSTEQSQMSEGNQATGNNSFLITINKLEDNLKKFKKSNGISTKFHKKLEKKVLKLTASNKMMEYRISHLQGVIEEFEQTIDSRQSNQVLQSKSNLIMKLLHLDFEQVALERIVTDSQKTDLTTNEEAIQKYKKNELRRKKQDNEYLKTDEIDCKKFIRNGYCSGDSSKSIGKLETCSLNNLFDNQLLLGGFMSTSEDQRALKSEKCQLQMRLEAAERTMLHNKRSFKSFKIRSKQLIHAYEEREVKAMRLVQMLSKILQGSLEHHDLLHSLQHIIQMAQTFTSRNFSNKHSKHMLHQVRTTHIDHSFISNYLYS